LTIELLTRYFTRYQELLHFKLELAFILAKQTPTWTQLLLGLQESWIENRDIVEIAKNFVREGDSREAILEIASVTDLSSSFSFQLSTLAEHEHEIEESVRLYWLRIILSWIYENLAMYDDPLGIVEDLYAGFEYPEEIRHLVRYNVPLDGYNPQGFSPQENELRLMKQWKNYLDSIFPNCELEP
jgi:hypothetical protein